MNTAMEVRSLIAPISGGGILLPGSMIAEVVNYAEPEAFATGPEWLLGELRWNGWQIPVVNFALLAGLTPDDAVPDRARVLVVKTFSMSASILHIGMIIEGLPRLKSVTPANLVEKEGQTPEGVFSHVQVEDQAAVIPDLDALALSIEKAVYNR
jgi:chemosensory pili system protein ChpC